MPSASTAGLLRPTARLVIAAISFPALAQGQVDSGNNPAVTPDVGRTPARSPSTGGRRPLLAKPRDQGGDLAASIVDWGEVWTKDNTTWKTYEVGPRKWRRFRFKVTEAMMATDANLFIEMRYDKQGGRHSSLTPDGSPQQQQQQQASSASFTVNKDGYRFIPPDPLLLAKANAPPTATLNGGKGNWDANTAFMDSHAYVVWKEYHHILVPAEELQLNDTWWVAVLNFPSQYPNTVTLTPTIDAATNETSFTNRIKDLPMTFNIRIRQFPHGERPCPRDCSGHGVCRAVGKCRCDTGWADNDCSVPAHVLESGEALQKSIPAGEWKYHYLDIPSEDDSDRDRGNTLRIEMVHRGGDPLMFIKATDKQDYLIPTQRSEDHTFYLPMRPGGRRQILQIQISQYPSDRWFFGIYNSRAERRRALRDTQYSLRVTLLNAPFSRINLYIYVVPAIVVVFVMLWVMYAIHRSVQTRHRSRLDARQLEIILHARMVGQDGGASPRRLSNVDELFPPIKFKEALTKTRVWGLHHHHRAPNHSRSFRTPTRSTHSSVTSLAATSQPADGSSAEDHTSTSQPQQQPTVFGRPSFQFIGPPLAPPTPPPLPCTDLLGRQASDATTHNEQPPDTPHQQATPSDNGSAASPMPYHRGLVGGGADSASDNGMAEKTPSRSWTVATGDEELCCSVCLVEFDKEDEVRVLDCSHVFHKDCIDQWFTGSTVCPLCKRDYGPPPPPPPDQVTQPPQQEQEQQPQLEGDQQQQGHQQDNTAAPPAAAAADGSDTPAAPPAAAAAAASSSPAPHTDISVADFSAPRGADAASRHSGDAVIVPLAVDAASGAEARDTDGDTGAGVVLRTP